MSAGLRVAGRLATRFDADVWPTLCVRVVRAASPRDVADHYLAAAWPPLSRGPDRWPEALAIGSPDADRALGELLVQLPAAARLFLVTPDHVDAALAAKIVLASDRHLGDDARAGLEAFVAHERARMRHAMTARYTDRDAGFERFRRRAALPPVVDDGS